VQDDGGGLAADSEANSSAAGEASGSPPKRGGRAGRNLPAAIAVGAGLGALILVPLFTVPAVWVGVVAAAIALGTFELVRALRVIDMSVPLVPLAVGAAAMPVAAYAAGTNGLVAAFALTVLAGVAVRSAGPADGLGTDIAAVVFTAAYVGFPAGFAALLTAAPDGHWRVIAFLGTVVASDIGGYTAGVLSGGRHKLAPTVSPGKSWEGFAGSALACVVVASVVMAWPLSASVWQGVLVGLAVVCTATIGDLGESLLKRDIGIKDMGSLLPGHGGIMDRLDSLLCTAPIAWLLVTVFLGTS
jgi:phosphatidate cytidylyltransferase